MKILFQLIVLFTILSFGCNTKEQLNDIATKDIILEQNQVALDTGTYQQPPPAAKQEDPEQTPVRNQPDLKRDWDKKIVKTATLNAEVKDFHAFSKSTVEKVKNIGGYISQENQNSTDYKIETSYTIKVPVEKFDETVSILLKDAHKINEKQITSEDVSAEYIDSRSRLEAKKQVRLQYLELLKGAKNMSDIIEVQQEINAIQEEIEMVSGRINYLGHSATMSTIHFTVYQILDASGNNNRDSFFEKFKAAFSNGWYWLGELIVGIISIWPFLLLIAFIVILLKRFRPVRVK